MNKRHSFYRRFLCVSSDEGVLPSSYHNFVSFEYTLHKHWNQTRSTDVYFLFINDALHLKDTLGILSS